MKRFRLRPERQLYAPSSRVLAGIAACEDTDVVLAAAAVPSCVLSCGSYAMSRFGNTAESRASQAIAFDAAPPVFVCGVRGASGESKAGLPQGVAAVLS